MSTDRWLTLCSMSPAKFSATIFQFEGMIHFCTLPSSSVPLSSPSQAQKPISSANFASPRDSTTDGADGSQVAQNVPLKFATLATDISPQSSFGNGGW